MLTVLITTYNRPKLLHSLLEDLVSQQGEEKFRVHVYDDCSTEDYSAVKEFLSSHGWKWHESDENHGKIRHGEFIGRIFGDQKRRKGPFLFLPDDVRLRDDFFPRMWAAWDSVEDRNKVCMRLLVSEKRRTQSSWTGVPVSSASDLADEVGFFDAIALFNKAFLRALDHTVPPVDGRTARDPNQSSGMGKAVSMALHRKRKKMYRVKESLLTHVVTVSQMHPDKRLEDSAAAAGDDLARRYLDPVVAAVATTPDRVPMLEKMVASILPQVNRLYVYLNGHESIPNCCKHERITVEHSNDHGNLTDSGKFFWADKVEGFYLTCDDDIVYPADYVETLVQHLEARDRKAVVTLHGRVFPERMPVKSYYKDKRIRLLHNQHSQALDEVVHVGGSGVMAFHTSVFKVSLLDFKAPRMADIWVSRAALEQGLPVVCLRRPEKWLKLLESEGIFRTTTDDSVQTDAVNEVSWPGTERHTADPLLTRVRPSQARNYTVASWDREAKIRGRFAAIPHEWNGRDYKAVKPALDRFVRQMLQGSLRPDSQILDFGAGWGRWKKMLEQFGQYQGVDASKEMVALAAMKGSPVTGVRHIPLGRKMPPYNAVFVFDVLSHMAGAQRERLREEVKTAPRKTRMVAFEFERHPRDLEFINDEFPWMHEEGSLRVGGLILKCYAGQVC